MRENMPTCAAGDERSALIARLQEALRKANLRTSGERVTFEDGFCAGIGHALGLLPKHWMLLVEAAEVDRMSEWQPIESAPRQVEFRCLLAHRFSVVTGYWDGEDWINERSARGAVFPATHWQPLPDPPCSATE